MCEYITSAKPFDFLCRSSQETIENVMEEPRERMIRKRFNGNPNGGRKKDGSIPKKKGIEYVFTKIVRNDQLLIKKAKQKVYIVPSIKRREW